MSLEQFLMRCPYKVDNSGDARPADRLHRWAAQFAWRYYRDCEGEPDPAYSPEEEVRRRVMLDHAADLLRCAEELTRQTVATARDMGATWEEVGGALGVSRLTAQQRYS